MMSPVAAPVFDIVTLRSTLSSAGGQYRMSQSPIASDCAASLDFVSTRRRMRPSPTGITGSLIVRLAPVSITIDPPEPTSTVPAQLSVVPEPIDDVHPPDRAKDAPAPSSTSASASAWIVKLQLVPTTIVHDESNPAVTWLPVWSPTLLPALAVNVEPLAIVSECALATVAPPSSATLHRNVAAPVAFTWSSEPLSHTTAPPLSTW